MYWMYADIGVRAFESRVPCVNIRLHHSWSENSCWFFCISRVWMRFLTLPGRQWFPYISMKYEAQLAYSWNLLQLLRRSTHSNTDFLKSICIWAVLTYTINLTLHSAPQATFEIMQMSGAWMEGEKEGREEENKPKLWKLPAATLLLPWFAVMEMQLALNTVVAFHWSLKHKEAC